MGYEARIYSVPARSLHDDVRTALEVGLVETGVYTELDESGHIDLVDGAIDTETITQCILNQLTANGWGISPRMPWTIVKEFFNAR